MSHPDLERLTAWVHGLLEPDEARAVADHAAVCGGCGASAARLEAEARVLRREVAREERLGRLKAELLSQARALGSPPKSPRRRRGWLLQASAAAALLAGLVFFLRSSGSCHSLESGRVALDDGRELSAPAEIPARRDGTLRALEAARLRLADGSTIQLEVAAGLRVNPEPGARWSAEVVSGEAEFQVPEAGNLFMVSPSGRAEMRRGRFRVRSIHHQGGDPMQSTVKGLLVTVLGGSLSFANPNGNMEAAAGQTALLAPSHGPLLMASLQDSPEELLRRLEELAAAVARLEVEVARLERENARLEARLSSGNAGAEWEFWKARKHPQPHGELELFFDHLSHQELAKQMLGTRHQCGQCHADAGASVQGFPQRSGAREK